MEESSSANVATAERVVYYADRPFYCLEEALRAIYKCFGVEHSKPHEDSRASDQKDEKVDEPSSQDASSTTEPDADTPSTKDPDPPSSTQDPASDPPSETSEVTPSTRALRAPPRTPLSSGSGPQTH